MKPPKSRKFLFALVARARLNLWLAKHLLKRFQDLMAAMGASELEETQCNNLKLHYDAYFRSNPLEYKELPHHEKSNGEVSRCKCSSFGFEHWCQLDH